MPRKAKPNLAAEADKLRGVQNVLRCLDGAMPTHAKDLRREAIETIEDVIAEIRRAVGGATA